MFYTTSSARLTYRGDGCGTHARPARSLVFLWLATAWLAFVASSIAQTGSESLDEQSLSEARLQLMRNRALAFQFKGKAIPKKLQETPLFRYDDVPRGYLDGTVWRLGAKGRPLAIVTTELHPRYGLHGTNRSNPKVVYDLVSMADSGFEARSPDIVWTPKKSFVKLKKLVNVDPPASSKAKRLIQLRNLARRFKVMQRVSETGFENQSLMLRLLPRNIDRYVPAPANANSDAAIFLFVAGRMPGVLLMLETDGDDWQFGIARLSAPCEIEVTFADGTVWYAKPDYGGSDEPYFATNATAVIPGVN